MKKTGFLLTLGVAAFMTACAPLTVTQQASRLLDEEKPDIAKARSLITPELTKPESMNNPETWYVAGLIAEKQLDDAKMKIALSKPYDEAKMYGSLSEMYKHYSKALDLAANAEGKGKVNEKVEKKIKKAFEDYNGFFVNAGSFYLNKEDFAKAHQYFNDYMAIRNLPMFKGSPLAEQDSVSMQIGFYSAYAASRINDNMPQAIKEYEAIKSVPYRQSDVYQMLANAYQTVNDSVKYIETLQDGFKLFPNEKFFTFNLINIYLKKGENEKAKEFLLKALADDPNNKQLYNVLGNVYEQGFKDPKQAAEYYTKALELDPEYADAMIGIGRICYNQAAALQSQANAFTDQKKFNEANNKAKELFKQALPYFEKAVQLQPDSREYLVALRGIYYNLGMNDKMAELEKKLGL